MSCASMATVIRAPQVNAPSRGSPFLSVCSKASKPSSISFARKRSSSSAKLSRPSSLGFGGGLARRFINLVPFASGEAETAETQEEEVEGTEIQDAPDGAASAEANGTDKPEAEEEEEPQPSVVMSSLESYKEAFANNDEWKLAEIEALLQSIEDEKITLEKKVASLTEELLVAKDRNLRINADFDNFRKRTERERLSLVENSQGDVVENLLPVLDNFERAKTQIKIETEGEEKLNNSYQSIYKQLIEILGSLGVVPVEPVGESFDPMLHEAIMREESEEFEEGVIMEEYRKGFKLGDRLLRPSMVKVSAGPGPAKPQAAEPSEGEDETLGGTKGEEHAEINGEAASS